MLRINFLVEILPLLLIVVGIVLVVTSRRDTLGRRHVGFALISVPVGICAYLIAGIVAAAIRGDGHFYSVPFGRYDIVNDNRAIVASAITWIVLVFVALAGLWRRKADVSEGERPLR